MAGDGRSHIFDQDANVLYEYTSPEDADGNRLENNPYVQEHIDLVATIRAGEHINETELTAVSTMTAIMGRVSAYTGKEVTWDEMMNSDMYLGPKEYKLGKSAIVKYDGVAPVPGEASKKDS